MPSYSSGITNQIVADVEPEIVPAIDTLPSVVVTVQSEVCADGFDSRQSEGLTICSATILSSDTDAGSDESVPRFIWSGLASSVLYDLTNSLVNVTAEPARSIL